MTKEAKHTPKPWNVYSNQKKTLFGITNYGAAKRITVGPSVTNEHDARLIAAAPELLEALELADAALSGANMDMKIVEKRIKSALAKAKGE